TRAARSSRFCPNPHSRRARCFIRRSLYRRGGNNACRRGIRVLAASANLDKLAANHHLDNDALDGRDPARHPCDLPAAKEKYRDRETMGEGRTCRRRRSVTQPAEIRLAEKRIVVPSLHHRKEGTLSDQKKARSIH